MVKQGVEAKIGGDDVEPKAEVEFEEAFETMDTGARIEFSKRGFRSTHGYGSKDWIS